MNRGVIKTLIKTFLGTDSDDPAYADAKLDPLVQSAYSSLLHDIQDANPHYLSTTVTLAADSSSSHTYTFASQSSPITNFAKWLEVRWTDADGWALAECRSDELTDFGGGYFALTGVDEAPVLTTSTSDQAGTPLYFRYAYWPAAFTSDSSLPDGIPVQYHDVVALETLFAFALGGEARRPPELQQRWLDRRYAMLNRVGRRGVQPSRSRLVNVD